MCHAFTTKRVQFYYKLLKLFLITVLHWGPLVIAN